MPNGITCFCHDTCIMAYHGIEMVMAAPFCPRKRLISMAAIPGLLNVGRNKLKDLESLHH